MLKKCTLLIFYLFVTSCGYEAIYSKKNIIDNNFSIDSLTFIGDRNVNLRIEEKLNNYRLNKQNKKISLKVISAIKKEILVKNISGDPTSFKTTITVNVEAATKNNFKSNILLTESFNYKNDSNKLNLKKYEREIEKNLAETISDKLIFKLTNIK